MISNSVTELSYVSCQADMLALDIYYARSAPHDISVLKFKFLDKDRICYY